MSGKTNTGTCDIWVKCYIYIVSGSIGVFVCMCVIFIYIFFLGAISCSHMQSYVVYDFRDGYSFRSGVFQLKICLPRRQGSGEQIDGRAWRWHWESHWFGIYDKNRVVATHEIFFVHPYLGKWSNLTHIFQLGWNHQFEKISDDKTMVGKFMGSWWERKKCLHTGRNDGLEKGKSLAFRV